MTDKLTALRLELSHLGYPPVPITGPTHTGTKSPGKAPLLPAWQRVCVNPGDDEIARWEQRHPDWSNTGILCGDIVAIDIDILDDELANKIELHARTRLGDTPLRRVGQAPKRLLVYRTDRAFSKMATGAFVKDGKRCLVEALAAGEQFVAFGGHPSGGEYTWTGDSPREMGASDLPTVTGAACAVFLDECATIMRFAKATPERVGGGQQQAVPGVRLVGAPPVQAWCGVVGNRPPAELVAEALRFIPCGELDYLQWITIGHSLCAALGDDGGKLWIAWSDGYAQNDRATSARKWAGFNTCRSSHRTLFSWAERRGWKGWPAADREGAPMNDARPGETPKPNGDARPSPRPLLEPLVAYDPAAELPYVVRGVIAAGQAITLIGGPGCGKTTLACLLAVCVAAGKPWMGFETQAGAVIYIAAEAPVGTHKRLTAACGEMGLKLDELAIRTMRQPLFLDDFDLVSRVIAEARDFVLEIGEDKLALVILDTFARCIAGADENSAEHIGAAMKTVDRIRAELGCAAMILHHPGKANPTQARGSSAMIGAVDGELVAERDTTSAESIGTLSPGKPNRDLELFQPVSYRLKPVDLGHDPGGDMVRTVVAVAEGGTVAARRQPLTGLAKIAHAALVDAIAAHGEPLPGHNRFPPHTTGVRVDNWRAVFYSRDLAEIEERNVDAGTVPATQNLERRRKRFQRAGQRLIEMGHAGMSQPFAWLINQRDSRDTGGT